MLVKDDVGKSKPSTYNLPSDGFTYGKALPRDKEGANKGNYFGLINQSLVSMTWAFHSETRDP